MSTLLIDLTGMRAGRLTVLGRAENGNRGQPRWNCVCDCGKSHVAYGAPLRMGIDPSKYSAKIHATRSCGCLQKDVARTTALNLAKHGQSRTPRYQMWCSAKRRASKAGVPFDLKFSDFPEIPATCPVLNIPLKFNSRRGPCSNSPTLDRIIPALGYVKGNIKIISHRANTIKSDGTAEEILAVARYIADTVCVVH